MPFGTCFSGWTEREGLHRVRPGATRTDGIHAVRHPLSVVPAREFNHLESAKANGIEPYAYLRYVFTELPKAQSVADFEALLPWNTPPDRTAHD